MLAFIHCFVSTFSVVCFEIKHQPIVWAARVRLPLAKINVFGVELFRDRLQGVLRELVRFLT
jgi:hypothetical protein